MTNSQLPAPVLLPQGPPLALLDQDHRDVQAQHHPPQKQQQRGLQQAIYFPHHRHLHVQDQDMAQSFLVQDMASGSASVVRGPALLQLQHSAEPQEEELDIFDYIHAKQDDDDDHEGEVQGQTMPMVMTQHLPAPLSFALVDDGDTFAAQHHRTIHCQTMRQSPAASSSSSMSSPVLTAHTPSSPTFSVLSPSSPSLSVGAHHDEFSSEASTESEQSEQDSDVLGVIHIKQENLDSTGLLAHHSSYIDSSMDLYGSAEPSPMAPPPQDLFRVLMDDMQTQAAIQREKFFSATTGSGTGMDSVEFLFHGPHPQSRAQTPIPSTLSAATLDSDSQLLAQASIDTDADMFASTVLADQEIKVDHELETKASPMHVDAPTPDNTTRAQPCASLDSVRVPSTRLEDVAMETVEPELDLPPSPTYSSSSSTRCSGSVTPVLSPILHPSKGAVNPTSPVASKVSDALSRMVEKSPKVCILDNCTSNTRDDRTAKGGNGGPSTLVSPIKELSFQSVIERHSFRRKAAETFKEELPAPSVITMQPAPKKKRRLNRDVNSQAQEESPRLSALPSPPSSVKTSPPFQPMSGDASVIESLILPAARASCHHEPVTPVSPTVAKVEPGLAHETTSTLATGLELFDAATTPATPAAITEAGAGAEADVEADADTADAADGTSEDNKKAIPPTGTNKRPWTTEEEKLLLKLVDDRIPIKDIAETLNRSVHSVRSRRQVLTDPGFVKGNGHAQPRRSKPDPSSKLPTYSQMAFLSLARLPELKGTLNDVASMVERLFSRHLNRIPRTGHKNLQIWRAQISDALAHEKGHPRPRFESFGVKRGRQWVYRLTDFGKGVMKAMGGVDQICEDLLRNNELAGGGTSCGPDGEPIGTGGADAGLGQGNGYGYSYSPETSYSKTAPDSKDVTTSSTPSKDSEELSAENLAASNAIANAMAAMAAGLAAMTAAEDEKSAVTAATKSGSSSQSSSQQPPSSKTTGSSSNKGSEKLVTPKVEPVDESSSLSAVRLTTTRTGRKIKA